LKPLHFILRLAVYNGTKTTGYEPAFKNANFGPTKITGNGLLNPTPEKLRSCLKISYHARESGQLHFIKKNRGDFLEKSELGWNLFLDGHTRNK
jgi:hypothetical protein